MQLVLLGCSLDWAGWLDDLGSNIDNRFAGDLRNVLQESLGNCLVISMESNKNLDGREILSQEQKVHFTLADGVVNSSSD